MKEFLLTTRKPRHSPKKGRFLLEYRFLRDTDSFIRPAKGEGYLRKMLMLKKMFCWYYSIASLKFFKKFFSFFFVQKKVNFRSTVAFLHVLEKNILIFLIRAHFCKNLMESFFIVRSGFVFVNGAQIKQTTYITKMGDVIEIIRWPAFFVVHYRHLLFFFEDFLRYRLNYFLMVTQVTLLRFLNSQQRQLSRRDNYKKYLVYLPLIT